MNRWLVRTSAFGLAAVLAFSPCAFAAKQKKKKKNVDLSANPLGNVQSQQPDKLLFDKAAAAMKKGKFDVARLDLQTLLNTYSDSEYAMRAKLLIGDTWLREGGSAALAQAESEYKDFITFFPNTPEAAEAQMKVGDIYFQQMEKPDRDPQNAENAEREYRTMLEQFPDSPLIPKTKQKLREVQEVLAQRQYEIGEFYATKQDWAASIARLQTVADTYPLFSHSDQTLITIGDAYATQAQMLSHAKIPPKAKAEIVKYYNDRAVDSWDRVVTRYPLAPHVEDAKDRLIAMGAPVPDPSPQALAESQAEEDSRVPVKIGKRALDLMSRGPDTVHAARVGEPSETSPTPIVAPDVVKQSQAVYVAAQRGEPMPNGLPAPGEASPVNAAIANGTAPPTTDQPATPLTLQNVQEGSGTSGNSVSVQVEAPNSASGDGNAAGGNASGTAGGTAPAANGATPGEATQPAAEKPLVAPVGPVNNQPLPAVDKPAEAPQQINDAQSGSQAQVTTGATTGSKASKKKKAPYDKKDESSSKHKKKTGLDKLNPF
jgi:outer membrane protein assembly factor BamD